MVYVIHFNQKFKGAQHYVGFAVNYDTFLRRIQHHRAGTGSTLMRAVNQAGIEWKVVLEFPDADRNFERKLKKQKKTSQFCPCCKNQPVLQVCGHATNLSITETEEA